MACHRFLILLSRFVSLWCRMEGSFSRDHFRDWGAVTYSPSFISGLLTLACFRPFLSLCSATDLRWWLSAVCSSNFSAMLVYICKYQNVGSHTHFFDFFNVYRISRRAGVLTQQVLNNQSIIDQLASGNVIPKFWSDYMCLFRILPERWWCSTQENTSSSLPLVLSSLMWYRVKLTSGFKLLTAWALVSYRSRALDVQFHSALVLSPSCLHVEFITCYVLVLNHGAWYILQVFFEVACGWIKPAAVAMHMFFVDTPETAKRQWHLRQ